MLRRYSLPNTGPLLALILALTCRGSLADAPGAGTDRRRGCEANLKFIYDALQVYRLEHEGNLPPQLSQLTPDLIRDPEILICPAVQQRGGLRAWRYTSDPGFDPRTSYVYEFTQQQIGLNLWRGLPKLTQGMWKAQQMFKLDNLGGLGGLVPIVRCFDHGGRRLNLAFNGEIYESELLWESKFADINSMEDLILPGRLFTDRSCARNVVPADMPRRDPLAPVESLDLTSYYNGKLNDGWQGFPGNDLTALPEGLQKFGNVLFDVRGVVQLEGEESTLHFPASIEGIAVKAKVRRIHFLHGVTFPMKRGDVLGRYVFQYANGESAELPIVYGRDVSDWWCDQARESEPELGNLAWSGQNAASAANGYMIRLYHSAWVNSHPEREVATIDFVSSLRLAAPFLIAITLDP